MTLRIGVVGLGGIAQKAAAGAGAGQRLALVGVLAQRRRSRSATVTVFLILVSWMRWRRRDAVFTQQHRQPF